LPSKFLDHKYFSFQIIVSATGKNSFLLENQYSGSNFKGNGAENYIGGFMVMELYIKNMVSLRCRLVVQKEFQKLGLRYNNIELGMVEIPEEITPDKRKHLKANLLKWGLELMEDKKSILVEKTRILIIEMIHYTDELPDVNNSDFLSEKLGYDYSYLSNIFSEVKGISLQHFIIEHKIERVKELLLYDELNLSEISWKLHYSSVAHLSNQFKKITGVTPSFYKKMKHKRSRNLEDL
jgi:AraC-like DNA-binding protein